MPFIFAQCWIRVISWWLTTPNHSNPDRPDWIQTDTSQFPHFHWQDHLWQTNHSLHLRSFLRVCRYALIMLWLCCRYALKFLAECMPSIPLSNHCSDTKCMKQWTSHHFITVILSHCTIRDCISKRYFKAAMNSTKFNLVVKKSRQDRTQHHKTRTDVSHTSFVFVIKIRI